MFRHGSQVLEHYQDHLDNAEEEVGLQILPEIQPGKKKISISQP